MQKVNTKAAKEMETVLRTCSTANAITAGINQIIAKYGARESATRVFPNGLQRVQVVDKDGLLIGEYTTGPKDYRDVDPTAQAAVSWAGGVVALAQIIGCSHTTISFWLYKKKPLSVEWALLLQKASKGKFRAKDIRPELF